MARPKTDGDERKKDLIRKALKKGAKYIHEISRETGLHPSTVHLYVNPKTGFMKSEVKLISQIGDKRSLVTYYDLRK